MGNAAGLSPKHGSSSLIHDACSLGEIDKLLEIVRHDPSQIELTGFLGARPLHYAAAAGQNKAVKFLLHQGAQVNVCSNNGWTPLMKALVHGHRETSVMLAEAGAILNVASWKYRDHIAVAEEWGLIPIWKKQGLWWGKEGKTLEEVLAMKQDQNDKLKLVHVPLTKKTVGKIRRLLGGHRVMQKITVLILEFIGGPMETGGGKRRSVAASKAGDSEETSITSIGEVGDETAIQGTQLKETEPSLDSEQLAASPRPRNRLSVASSSHIRLSIDTSAPEARAAGTSGRRRTEVRRSSQVLTKELIQATCALVRTRTERPLALQATRVRGSLQGVMLTATAVARPAAAASEQAGRAFDHPSPKGGSQAAAAAAQQMPAFPELDWSDTESEDEEEEGDSEEEGEEVLETRPVHVHARRLDLEALEAAVAREGRRALEARDEHRSTPLLLAAYRGDAAVVAWLLGRGADSERRDAAGRTALMEAARLGHAAAAAALLAAGADLFARDNGGDTALLLALANGREAAARALAAAGARVGRGCPRPLAERARAWGLHRAWTDGPRRGGQGSVPASPAGTPTTSAGQRGGGWATRKADAAGEGASESDSEGSEGEETGSRGSGGEEVAKEVSKEEEEARARLREKEEAARKEAEARARLNRLMYSPPPRPRPPPFRARGVGPAPGSPRAAEALAREAAEARAGLAARAAEARRRLQEEEARGRAAEREAGERRAMGGEDARTGVIESVDVVKHADCNSCLHEDGGDTALYVQTGPSAGAKQLKPGVMLGPSFRVASCTCPRRRPRDPREWCDFCACRCDKCDASYLNNGSSSSSNGNYNNGSSILDPDLLVVQDLCIAAALWFASVATVCIPSVSNNYMIVISIAMGVFCYIQLTRSKDINNRL